MKYTNFRSIAAAAASSFVLALAACGGGITTDSAVTPVAKPTITAPPVSQTVEAGKTATFMVTATGGGTLAYQWKKNGVDVSGATSNPYTIAAAMADDGTKYSVAVTNSAGTTTSSEATLTVTAAAVVATKPLITTHPAAQTVVTETTATFSVQATGGGALAYQWKKNGTDIPGATASTYTTPATSDADKDARFSVMVTNSAGSVTSNEAKLGVSATAVAPAITTQPAAQSVVAGSVANFSVIASGTSPFSYQWKKNGTDISGATSIPYTIATTTMADSGAYSVVVTNSAGMATSTDATLTVTATAVAPAITTQPAAQTVTEGESATFSVTASGTAPFTYQWKKNGADIEGVTTSSHTTDATSLADSGAVFTVVVTNSVGSVTSSGAALTVNAAVVAPAITTQPTSLDVAPGNTATFTVTATGTTLIYQWKKGGTDIPGATSSSYAISNTTSANDGVYSVVVSNSAGTVTSSNATLTVAKYSLVANGSGSTYATTDCVKDNNTGLIWEGKPTTGTRAGNLTYSNYDSITGLQSAINTDVTQDHIDASTNSIGHRNLVNTSALCGYTDWRLPTVVELLGLVDLTSTSTYCPSSCISIKIDGAWFPNSVASYYWSSSPATGNQAYRVGFEYGLSSSSSRGVAQLVRLVRGTSQ